MEAQGLPSGGPGPAGEVGEEVQLLQHDSCPFS